jgi:hypothetical protein
MGTLAIVEDPDPGGESSEGQDSDRPAIPITSSVYGTIKHLRACAGPWFWLRGAFYFISYRAVVNMDIMRPRLPDLSDLSNRSLVGQAPVYLLLALISLAISNWQMTWLHAIISMPSTESFLERLIRYRSSASVMSAVMMHMSFALRAFDYGNNLQTNMMDRFQIKSSCCNQYHRWVLSLFPSMMKCLVSLLVRIWVLRLAASTLPQYEQPVIRLDPTLGSEDDWSVVNGWNIGHAWRTLTGPAMARAWKILIRQFAISMAITMLGMMVDPGFHRDVDFPLIWFH